MPDAFDEAFEAKLAAFDTPEEESETPAEETVEETVVEEEPEEQPVEQPRDDQGRSLPKFTDPDVQSYVEKFGGDINQALRSAVEAQSLIGRQGQELGELRALRQKIEALEGQVQAPAPAALPVNTQELLEENPGALAEWAYQNGREDVYEQAMDAWFDLQPRQAARFEQALMMGEMERRVESRIQPIAAPIAEQTAAREISSAQRSLSAKYPDFNDILSTATEAELADFPPDVAEKIQSGTAVQKEKALEALYRWIKADRLAAGPMTQNDTTDTPRQDPLEKIEAVVVSASSSPAREGKSGVQSFKEFLLEPDPTNWRTGLGE